MRGSKFKRARNESLNALKLKGRETLQKKLHTLYNKKITNYQKYFNLIKNIQASNNANKSNFKILRGILHSNLSKRKDEMQ